MPAKYITVFQKHNFRDIVTKEFADKKKGREFSLFFSCRRIIVAFEKL